MGGEQAFIVGETVEIVARVNKPGTRVPDDPDEVVLVSLHAGSAPVVVPDSGFARVSDGHYLLSIATDDLAPGTYTYLVRASSGPEKVVLAEDTFVLRARAFSP